MTSAIAGYLSHRCSGGLSRRLYGWGVIFALSHYAFGYIVRSPPSRSLYLHPDLDLAYLPGFFFFLRVKADKNKEVSQVIEKIAHGPVEQVKDMQRYWLKIHTARTLCKSDWVVTISTFPASRNFTLMEAPERNVSE